MGALRPMGLAKYFTQFGWEPIILTAKLPYSSREDLKEKLKIVEVPSFDIFNFLRKMLGLGDNKTRIMSGTHGAIKSKIKQCINIFIKTLVAFPDRNNGWYFIASRAADSIILNHKIDCILSTSSPWTSALVARRLKVKYGVPWVADFRDLWSQNHRYGYLTFRKVIDKKLEQWTLEKADMIVMVSEERTKKLQRIHARKNIVPITLGFDSDDFNDKKDNYIKNKLIITYAGNIKEKHNPEPLFKAIAELIYERKIERYEIELRFWGTIPDWIRNMIIKCQIEDIVKLNDLIPRKDIIPKLSESHLLLMLNWNDPQESGIHPGKLFDYLGAKVPILAIGEHKDVVTKVLQETKAGVQINEVDKLKKYLIEILMTFKENGSIPYSPVAEAIERYSYKSIAERYVDLIESIIKS